MNYPSTIFSFLLITSPLTFSQQFELEKDGKTTLVTRQQFFDHYLPQAKGKYVLVPVPDG